MPMAIRFLLDECIRDNKLLNAIAQHNEDHPEEFIDAVRVGDEGAPDCGTVDADLVRWAANHGRIIVSQDANTLRSTHDSFVADGSSTPGLLLVKRGCSILDLIEALALIGNEGSPEDYANRADFIPF
jgi:hypothetical protein